MHFFAIATAILGLAASSTATPTPQEVDGLVERELSTTSIEARQVGVQRAWLFAADCGGDANFQWNAGNGCISYIDRNVPKDMYSVYVGGNCRVRLYHGNNRCSGTATKDQRGTNACYHLSGESIKSYRIDC
ncbi:hypothetical protein QBC39DRAFT_383425 [Podospora conica]|nr:hypothetical protein QBC39DRAFT_383425 [Schizothecium conicum]